MTFVLNLSLLNVPYVLKQIFQNKETASSENWDFVSQLVSITSFVEILTILLFFVLVIKNPGNLKRKDDFEFPTWNELMENVNFKMLCPECQIIKSPRSRHCYECQKCVSRFDHHCPWVKNCIGGKNNVTFFFFLFSLIALIALTFTIEVEVLMMTYQCH
jgi:DHHC palmitoyltransferase